MPSKIQIMTNEHQEELKEHGTYEFPVLVSDEALSRFYTSSFQWPVSYTHLDVYKRQPI